ncbi:MAG: cytochrome c biogenesis protein ResB [Prevotella sp.]|nr:cytochrome c biogenesis protein ResB [Prevotella sp.]
MFEKLWKMKEGFAFGAGLLTVGFALQYTVGAINWSAFAFPVNMLFLFLLLLFLAVVYGCRNRVRLFAFSFTAEAAVPSLFYAVILTIVMGLVRQVPSHVPSPGVLGLSQMLSFWPFVLIYLWLSVIVALIAIHQLFHFRWRKLPSLFCHMGLFIAIVSATLGSADMQRYKLKANMEMPEWRGVDEKGNVHELPVAILLKKFTIEEYPPKILIVDNHTGEGVPADKPEIVVVDKHFKEGRLSDWRIRVISHLSLSAPVMTRDTTYYTPWASSGAVTSLLVEAQPVSGGQGRDRAVRGWITCGSYLFPFQNLKLNNRFSLVMSNREPARYISRIQVLTKTQKNILTSVEVNKPFSVDGWDIYQVSYDERMGRWSETSTFELIADPWLPAVYTGIGMLLVGAMLVFAFAQKRKPQEREAVYEYSKPEQTI